jgi:hypothetical protein
LYSRARSLTLHSFNPQYTALAYLLQTDTLARKNERLGVKFVVLSSRYISEATRIVPEALLGCDLEPT